MLIKALEREREAIRQQAVEATKKEMAGMLSSAIERERQQATEARNREIVRAMAEKGFALTLIAEVTQLPLEEIERLLTEEPAANR